MGVDLASDAGGELRFSGVGWAFYLNLAQSYGWRPLGTTAPDDMPAADWSGQYDSSDGQHVRRDDATSIANALASAWADLGREEAEKVLAAKLTEDLSKAIGKPVPAVQLPNDDSLLRQFVAFCRKGGSRID
jgi:hypothetical protein